MKILIATPLYPPDVAAPAPFIKTLATHLAGDHDVSVIHYGELPEEVPGVIYHSVPGVHALPVRTARFTRALISAARQADVVLFENGPSVELPAILSVVSTRTPFVLHEGDTRARDSLPEHPARRLLHTLARRRARAVVETSPPERPEILPFADYPSEAMETYDRSWEAFVKSLIATLRHVTK